MLQNSSYKYYSDNLSPGIRYDIFVVTVSINGVHSAPATDFEFTSNILVFLILNNL